MYSGEKEIPVYDAAYLFQKIYKNYKYRFLLESLDISHVYGRLSLIGVDASLCIKGKDEDFSISAYNKRGKEFIKMINIEELKINNLKVKNDEIIGKIVNKHVEVEETQRSKMQNIAQVIRVFLKNFESKNTDFIGLYGAFSYDFIRLFEDIGKNSQKNDIPDFQLFLYDTFIFFDHLKEKAKIICYRESEELVNKNILELEEKLFGELPSIKPVSIKNPKLKLSKSEYETLVQKSRQYIIEGEIFEIVIANILKADIKGDPFSLYLKYRDANPSPYMFYFDFGDNQLIGASPEMMVRCENGIVNMRPISGTAPRSIDPIEDHENMLKLLQSEKERAELDMLIDLGRNDLSRVCKPGIKISDYRFVEKYSKVMHTVTHISGELKKGYIAFDALISCLNNGTLTGAPKVKAMEIIEKLESSRRGFYGGALGYITLSGNLDTAIIIRSAHIKDGEIEYRSGASIVYDSVPENEYIETINKARAFLSVFGLSEKFD